MFASFGFVKIAEEILEGEARRFHEGVLLASRTAGVTAQTISPPLFFQEMRRCWPLRKSQRACESERSQCYAKGLA